MSVALNEQSALPARRAASAAAEVLIATINRAAGDTGVHTHTRGLTAGLNKSHVMTQVVTPFDGSWKWLPLFAVRPLLLKRLHPTASTLWYRHWHTAALRENLRQAVNSAEPRHILTQCPLSARAALDVRAELQAERRITISTVCHFNRSEADEYRDKGELKGEAQYAKMLAFESDTLAAVDHVIYVSQWARELVEQQRGIRTRASSVIWNGVARSPAAVMLTRTDLRLADDHLVLINVGSLEPRKNQVGLLDLFGSLVKRHPKARLLLVGDGPGRAAVEAKIVELGLSSQVKLLGHRRDAAELMRVADLYIHYALAENCPMVLIEAAASGLPVAALPVGGVPEILETLGEAVTLDADDHEASLARLAPLLTSAERRAAAGRRAAEAFATHFEQTAMIGRYVDVIRTSATEARS